MPPKRKTPAKAANPAPSPPKPISSTKPAPAPVPALAPMPPPPPPPPPPVESPSTKVRKEWSKFYGTWYEPQKKKLTEKLQKDLIVKYKKVGTPNETQKLREMELFEKREVIAAQLAQPARAEWERRLEVAHLREDQWDDMTGEEQQDVMSVFVGFFNDDFEDITYDNDVSAEPSSIEEESVVEEPPPRVPSFPTPALSKQLIPPTPTRGNFEFVNPTSFFADTLTPPHPIKKLPALSMDHLATLDPSAVGRAAEPISAGLGSFQNWASEAGIVSQQAQAQAQLPKPPVISASSSFSHTLSARPRATDHMSRQASAASTFPSPPVKTSSPQYSPPNHTTKFSPPTNADTLAPGKRYIGPMITEDEPDLMDEELLRSKMAAEYQQYKIGLRIQMIYQFHHEAAEIEIKLVETLMADEGTKESRARAVQEHETSMMRLREQKEEERKRLCAEEREKRREELRSHVAQLRSAQNRDVDPRAKQNPPKPWPDKSSLGQPRAGYGVHQKENVPLAPPAPAPASFSKLEAPSITKSISTLSQDEVSANEALFANAMATMNQGKPSIAVLTAAQASSNEALFANAAAMLSGQGKLGSNGKGALQPPSSLKKSNSARSQEFDVPEITVSLAEAPPASSSSSFTPESVQLPPTTKGKKGKKGQQVPPPPPVKPITITEEPEMDAEPPPAPSLWGAAAVAAKAAWGAASASLPSAKAKQNVSVTEELDSDPSPMMMAAQAPVWGNVNVSTKKTTAALKKGKKVTITEEPDAEADLIWTPSPPTPAPAPPAPSSKSTPGTKGAWGAVMNGKSKAMPSVTVESEPELPLFTPPAPSAWSKKPSQTGLKSSSLSSSSSSKPQLKVAISEEQESEVEPVSVPTRTNKGTAKTAWSVSTTATAAPGPGPAPSGVGASSRQASKKAVTPQPESFRGAGAKTSFKSVRVESVPDPEDDWAASGVGSGDSGMPGGMDFGDVDQEEAGVEDEEEEEEEEEEADTSAWFKPENVNYWANFMAGQSETETQLAPRVPEELDKHAVWTPTVGNESDDEGDAGAAEDELASNMWFQYAISGGEMPSFGGTPDEPPAMPADDAHNATRVWGKGKGKKSTQLNGDAGNRVQQTPVFDRAAFPSGQWPKMESWLSPPSRVGQSSGSTRVF